MTLPFRAVFARSALLLLQVSPFSLQVARMLPRKELPLQGMPQLLLGSVQQLLPPQQQTHPLPLALLALLVPLQLHLLQPPSMLIQVPRQLRPALQ